MVQQDMDDRDVTQLVETNGATHCRGVQAQSRQHAGDTVGKPAAIPTPTQLGGRGSARRRVPVPLIMGAAPRRKASPMDSDTDFDIQGTNGDSS